MKTISWVPGIVATPAPITIPGGSPTIDRVISAAITRIRSGFPVHLHDVLLEIVADAAGDRVNSALGPPVTLGRPVAGATIVGVQATRGVQNNAAPAGADPVVAAVPTRLSATTFSLDVNTTLGDILTLIYEEVGSRVAVA